MSETGMVTRIAEKWAEKDDRFEVETVEAFESAIREALEECAKKLEAAALELDVDDLKFSARLLREEANRG